MQFNPQKPIDYSVLSSFDEITQKGLTIESLFRFVFIQFQPANTSEFQPEIIPGKDFHLKFQKLLHQSEVQSVDILQLIPGIENRNCDDEFVKYMKN